MPSPYLPETAEITDLQYAVLVCGLPLELAAKRVGTTPQALMRELQATKVPDWLVASARQQWNHGGGSGVPAMSMS